MLCTDKSFIISTSIFYKNNKNCQFCFHGDFKNKWCNQRLYRVTLQYHLDWLRMARATLPRSLMVCVFTLYSKSVYFSLSEEPCEELSGAQSRDIHPHSDGECSVNERYL